MSMSDLVVNRWGARFRGHTFPCAIGRAGIGIKQGEGDGVTPLGSFEILSVMYRPDRVRLHNAITIPVDAVWSDDPKDPHYNTLQRAFQYPHSHERLRRPDPLYDIVADLNFNRSNPKPGKGSAIFMHVWRGPRVPTEGCIAFRKSHLVWILENWTPKSRVITTA